jgi:hypothetical protein
MALFKSPWYCLLTSQLFLLCEHAKKWKTIMIMTMPQIANQNAKKERCIKRIAGP